MRLSRAVLVVALLSGNGLLGCSAGGARVTDCAGASYVVRPKTTTCKNCDYYGRVSMSAYAEDSICCPQVSITELAAAVPCVGPMDKIVAACGDIGPSEGPDRSDYFDLLEVIGPHEVRVKHVGCECRCTELNCQYEQEVEYFNRDPEKRVVLGRDVTLDEALAVLDLYESGRLIGADTDPEWQGIRAELSRAIRTRVERKSGAFELTIETCACSIHLRVRLEGQGASTVLVLLERSDWGCV